MRLRWVIKCHSPHLLALGVKYWPVNSGLVVAQKVLIYLKQKVWRKMSEIWLCTKKPRLNFDSSVLSDLSEQELLQISAHPHTFWAAKKISTVFFFFFLPQTDYLSKVTSPEGFHTAVSSLVLLRKVAGQTSCCVPQPAAGRIISVDVQCWPLQGLLLSWRGAKLFQ